VEYAAIPDGGSVAVLGLGPIGQMSTRIAHYRGARVVGVDLVPERLEMARRHGIEVLNAAEVDDVPSAIRELTGGRGTDSVIDAVGVEAHGSAPAQAAQTLTSLLPRVVAEPLMKTAGIDRLAALNQAIATVRRGGTLSIIGVYGGMADPLPMLTMFDKGIEIRMGQAHVKRWIGQLMPLLLDESDPLGVEDLTTHRLPLEDAARGYEIFQKKAEGAIKVVLSP
jgi:threonine dehydrogenase-like Zn-dependent dehydrogenase